MTINEYIKSLGQKIIKDWSSEYDYDKEILAIQKKKSINYIATDDAILAFKVGNNNSVSFTNICPKSNLHLYSSYLERMKPLKS